MQTELMGGVLLGEEKGEGREREENREKLREMRDAEGEIGRRK